MNGVRENARCEKVGSGVISSLLNTAGGIQGVTQIVRHSTFESRLLNAYLATSDVNDIDLLTQLLGVEPLVSEQEYA